MPTPANKIKFGEWLPDQEALDNPGVSICQNLRWVSGNYVPYLPVGNYGSGTVLAKTFLRALRVLSGTGYVVVAMRDPIGFTATKLYWGSGAGGTFTDVTPTGLTNTLFDWTLAQYNNIVIAANAQDLPQYQTITGSPGTFVQLTGVNGPAPKAGVVGVIGQFVVLGNLTGISHAAVQWSVINDPTNWPTPQSAIAIAGQSGQQFLDATLGGVLGIIGGDQWGVILCDGGLVRMLYQGGNTVFQFDTYAREPGPISSYAFCKVGQKIYFAGFGGFRVTDGTTTAPIGDGRVDQTFIALISQNTVPSTQCGVDYKQKLIYWTVFTGVSACTIFCYNYEEDKWTNPQDLVYAYVQREEIQLSPSQLEAFGSTKQCGTLSATPGTALIETGEVELNPGSRALVTGFRPQVSGTTPAVTVLIGSRNDQGSAPVYTAALTPNAVTGFADCFVDANYHRVQVSIAGAFSVASGGEFRSQPTGAY